MDNLSSYLNDHLAGAAGALEHLDHLAETCNDPRLAAFFRGLYLEIDVDRAELKKLMDEVGEARSVVRQAGAWFAEKLARVKMGPGDSGDELGLFFSLEALALGILGKQKLWAALAQAAEQNPALRRLDYPKLETRAVSQAEQVEAKRLELARRLFS
jgi:hypothetical protein